MSVPRTGAQGSSLTKCITYSYCWIAHSLMDHITSWNSAESVGTWKVFSVDKLASGANAFPLSIRCLPVAKLISVHIFLLYTSLLAMTNTLVFFASQSALVLFCRSPVERVADDLPGVCFSSCFIPYLTAILPFPCVTWDMMR